MVKPVVTEASRNFALARVREKRVPGQNLNHSLCYSHLFARCQAEQKDAALCTPLGILVLVSHGVPVLQDCHCTRRLQPAPSPGTRMLVVESHRHRCVSVDPPIPYTCTPKLGEPAGPVPCNWNNASRPHGTTMLVVPGAWCGGKGKPVVWQWSVEKDKVGATARQPRHSIVGRGRHVDINS